MRWGLGESGGGIEDGVIERVGGSHGFLKVVLDRWEVVKGVMYLVM